jgi:hypothetical protein
VTTRAQGRTALSEELGGVELVGLDRLSGAQLQQLADLVAEAKRHQDEVLAEGADNAVRHVPRIVRTPLRRTLGI